MKSELAKSKPGAAPDTSIRTYRARRDFAATPEPSDAPARRKRGQPIFVVQQHAARRLHWDFRLEHGGVLWSWAVPKGPSMDTADKRLAVRTEDHPLEYADFAGTIPQGHYGAGKVEIWDRGTWAPIGDAAERLDAGELKFSLTGQRLSGRFVLIRMKPRGQEQGENWLLIKEHDDAPVAVAPRKSVAGKTGSPAPGAVRGALPEAQKPQLAQLTEEPPEGDGWISEVKFDGYRLLAFKQGDTVRLMTRNGLDWTNRLPSLAQAVGRLPAGSALVDGELVALRRDGVTDFKSLQQALSDGVDTELKFYAFDLLHLDGWDLRPSRLADRKMALARLLPEPETLRYSDHLDGASAHMRRKACGMGLEGLICKQADAPYRAGRGSAWRKLKCVGREEFLVLGWMPPEGSRAGLGSLQLGYRDTEGGLQFAGGVGSGFTDKELTALRRKLDGLKAAAPEGLRFAEEPPDRTIRWVRPELVAEIQFAGWSGAGRLRHAVYLGLRADKTPQEVVRDMADPQATRTVLGAKPPAPGIIRGRQTDGVTLTHPDRELWPGVTKRDLADYWTAVADYALPEIAGRPLALVRCPDGAEGEHFFQKHGKRGFPKQIRSENADGAPYLVIDDRAGLTAAAQIAALELHAWGAREPDPLHPDRLVFDLDPDEGLAFAQVVMTAKEVRDRLQAIGLASFCRTTGGKGLHVVVPLRPQADWTTARAFSKAFAEQMVREAPDRYVAKTSKAARHGRILIDWLRNGLGSTAVASYSPRARPGATVATRLTWREVTAKLDPQAFTIATLPARLKKQRVDPWDGFDACDQILPTLTTRSKP